MPMANQSHATGSQLEPQPPPIDDEVVVSQPVQLGEIKLVHGITALFTR
jgi:hypothetical protein